MTSIPAPGFESNEDLMPDEAIEPWERMPIADELTGESHAENVAHMHARMALLNHLNDDSTIGERFQLWSEETGREPIVSRAVEVLDEIAIRIQGLESRGELFELANGEEEWSDTVTLTVDTEEEAARLMALPKQAIEVLDEFNTHCSQAEDDGYVGRAAVELVRDEWQLNWPWLAVEIIKMYLYGQLGRLQGWQYQFNFWYEPGPTVLDYPMPEDKFGVDVVLGTHDESIGDALERILGSIESEMIRVFRDPIRNASPETPRGTFTNPEQIERDVTWWYRNRLCGASVRSLAREFNQYGDSRQTVKAGIRRAEYWLGLTPWEFR